MANTSRRPLSRKSISEEDGPDLGVMEHAFLRQLLLDRNQTEMDFPRDKCVHQLFEDRVRENPDADALTFNQVTWTYHELNTRADGISRCLRDVGMSPGCLVAVCVERSAEMVAALLGVWKAACAYVPIDSSQPADRIKAICLDARVSLVITNKDFASNFAGTNLRLLFIDDLEGDCKPRGKAMPAYYPEDLAYVIYTSDSIGKPHGVQIRHRSVANMLTAVTRATGFTKEDHVAAVTSISFDFAVVDLFLPLTNGAQVTIVERNVIADGVKLAKLVEQPNITVLQAMPSTWRMLVKAGWRGNPRFTSLCGGEMLSNDLAQDLLRRSKSVWNLYGRTEATVYSTAWKVEKGKPSCIGKPLANVQAYILDKDLQPVPRGVVGELHIGGEGLAAGYLNRPDLTAERFISNPCKRESVIYKTGDLARYLPDGNIECVGR